MKLTLLLALLLVAGIPAQAELPEGETVYPISANSLVTFAGPSTDKVGGLRASALPPNVKLDVGPQADLNAELSAPLGISYGGSGPLQLRLAQFNVGRPLVDIRTHHYAITGEVSYENVAPGSYLEMWSYFASPAPGYPEGAYFSRTLADGGQMGKLDGTSSWREFWLPFDSTGTTSRLERLEMNLRLGGPGTVHLRNMKLMQYPDAPNPALVHIPAAPVSPPGHVTLVIGGTPDNTALTYTLDGTSYPDLGTVQEVLKARHISNPRTDLLIKADAKVPYEVLQSAMQAGVNAGMEESVVAVPPPAATPASSSGPGPKTLVAVGEIVDSEKTQALKTIWFCLGVAATALTLLVITSLIFVSRVWQRRNHERELRRMASLDS